MLKKDTFYTYFIGVALVATLFLLRPFAPYEPRITRDVFFIFLSIAPILIFGVGEINKYFKFSLLYIACASLFNQYSHISQAVIFQMMFVLSGIIFFQQCLYHIKKEQINSILNIIATLTIIQSIIVLIEYCNINIYFEILKLFNDQLRMYAPTGLIVDSSFVVSGSLMNSNLSAASIAIGLASLFRGKFTWFIPVVIASIIILDSTCANGCALASIAYYLYKKDYLKLRYIILILIVFIYIIFRYKNIDFFTGNGRFEAWKLAFMYIIKNKWIVGMGPGFFYDNFGSINGVIYRQAHNEYLECLMAYGLIGLALLTSIAGWIFYRCKNVVLCSMMIAIFINCFANFTFHISGLAMLSIIIFSVSFIDAEE